MNKRWLLGLLSILTLAVLALIGGVVVYLNSPAFEEQARRYIIREVERRTGGQASLKKFQWNFWQQRFRLQDLTIRGLEPEDEAPLAHFAQIDIGLNFRTLFQRRIDLFELALTRPEFHIVIGSDGKTNIPSPENRGGGNGKPFNFQISIENFHMMHGSALVNERRLDLDFSVANLAGVLDYHTTREVLESHIRYDGVYDRSSESKPSIPYTLSADTDYTRGTLVAHRIAVQSGKTQVKLQGRINEVLNPNISGKLEYTGTVDVPFLNYFFTRETFAGKAAIAGFLEFSRGYFFTRGNTTSDAIDFEGWHATNLTGEYAYHHPDNRLSFRKLKTGIVGGDVAGSLVVEKLPGPSRVVVDIEYSGIDAASLRRAYPWDPKYRIFSSMTGTLKGWFQGKLERYDFSGANFKSTTPDRGVDLVPLPLDGSAEYEITPGQARVANADVRFYSTAAKADGLIHESKSDVKFGMQSSDLRDLAFLYSDANGSGSFNGVLSGAIKKPSLAGDFTLQNHLYRNWKIQNAAGSARLDTQTENVEMRDVRVTQGESEVLLNGRAHLDGSSLDLRVQSNRVTGPDLA
ncbi:MAG: hypothetical protein DMG13_00525, partial [Acidobacteria bacterium]